MLQGQHLQRAAVRELCHELTQHPGAELRQHKLQLAQRAQRPQCNRAHGHIGKYGQRCQVGGALQQCLDPGAEAAEHAKIFCLIPQLLQDTTTSQMHSWASS